jgi:hypothetical protein
VRRTLRPQPFVTVGDVAAHLIAPALVGVVGRLVRQDRGFVVVRHAASVPSPLDGVGHTVRMDDETAREVTSDGDAYATDSAQPVAIGRARPAWATESTVNLPITDGTTGGPTAGRS